MDQPLNILEDVCREFGFSGLTEDIRHIRKESLNHSLLNVAVFGRFKAGKSSFLNHLLGIELLPAGATPVTNVITHITYGDSDSVVVFFRDGHQETISPEAISSFVNEKENPENIRQVKYVDITLAESVTFKHLRFIDTPGIGSLFAHNTTATKQWVPGTGVAILAVDPGHPMSEDEMRFLETLRKYTPDIRLLLTKTDLYPDDDLREVETFIKETLDSTPGNNIPVYRYSVYKDPDRHRERFIRDVLIPLETSYAEKKGNITGYKITSLAKECMGFLEITQIGNRKSEQERSELLKKILDGQNDRERIQKELRLIAESFTAATRRQIAKRVITQKEILTESLKKRFKKEFPYWKGNLFRLSRKFEQWTAGELRKELVVIVETEYPFFNSIPENARQHFEKYFQTLQSLLYEKVEKEMDIQLFNTKKDIGLQSLPPPDVAVSWAFDSNIDLLWFLFPMFLFKPLFGRYFEKHIQDEVEKNLYRLTGQVTEKINEVIMAMKEETMHRYDLEISTIRNALEDVPGRELPVSDAMEKIITLLSP